MFNNLFKQFLQLQYSMEITVIGGGPVGCYTALLLARSGHQVSVYENHSEIGSPIQCTGILTAEFDKFGFKDQMHKFLVNTIDCIEVNSPGKKLIVNQKDYIVCRRMFDNFFANLAQKERAKIYLNHSFLRREGKQLVIKDIINNVEKAIVPDIVIAADGPLSRTAKAFGFYQFGRKNYFGVQATVEGNFDGTTIKTYFGNKVCPGLFAWIVPESSRTARVGLATRKNSKFYFDKFIQKHGLKVKEVQAGVIPLYHPKQKLKKDNCYLVGDASSYVKATTLGGIVPAFQQARILVDCINNGKSYEREIKQLRKQMWAHLKVHKIFNKFSDKDWDKLVNYVGQPKIQRVFEKYTRDNPLPLMSTALLREPRFLRFIKYLFK